MERKLFYRFYAVTAVLSCLCLLGVLLFVVAYLPEFGAENPRTLPVVERYVTRGLEETGAVKYDIKPVCIYSVTAPDEFDGAETFGGLFYAEIKELEKELQRTHQAL